MQIIVQESQQEMFTINATLLESNSLLLGKIKNCFGALIKFREPIHL